MFLKSLLGYEEKRDCEEERKLWDTGCLNRGMENRDMAHLYMNRWPGVVTPRMSRNQNMRLKKQAGTR